MAGTSGKPPGHLGNTRRVGITSMLTLKLNVIIVFRSDLAQRNQLSLTKPLKASKSIINLQREKDLPRRQESLPQLVRHSSSVRQYSGEADL